MTVKIGGKQLMGSGTLPFTNKEVETRKVKDRLFLADLPKKVFKRLSDEEKAAFLEAGDKGLSTKSKVGLEVLKKALDKNNMDEVMFEAEGDLYIASSANLHRQGLFSFGLGREGDRVEYDGKQGVLLHTAHEMDHGRKAAMVALAASGVGIGLGIGLGAALPAAGVPVKVLGGTATVVAQKTATAPAWLMTLKGAAPFAGAATGALASVLGAVVGWFKRDRSGLEAISDEIKPQQDDNNDTPPPPAGPSAAGGSDDSTPPTGVGAIPYDGDGKGEVTDAPQSAGVSNEEAAARRAQFRLIKN